MIFILKMFLLWLLLGVRQLLCGNLHFYWLKLNFESPPISGIFKKLGFCTKSWHIFLWLGSESNWDFNLVCYVVSSCVWFFCEKCSFSTTKILLGPAIWFFFQILLKFQNLNQTRWGIFIKNGRLTVIMVLIHLLE